MATLVKAAERGQDPAVARKVAAAKRKKALKKQQQQQQQQAKKAAVRLRRRMIIIIIIIIMFIEGLGGALYDHINEEEGPQEAAAAAGQEGRGEDEDDDDDNDDTHTDGMLKSPPKLTKRANPPRQLLPRHKTLTISRFSRPSAPPSPTAASVPRTLIANEVPQAYRRFKSSNLKAS
jgi:hypothetical protein